MIKMIIKRLLILILGIILAIAWILFDVRPATAQDNTVNYTYSQQRNSDFSHKDLSKGVFAAADLTGANFEGANLANSILTKAVFAEANLTGVNLTESLMDRVDLTGANLTNAIVTGAIATSTNFSDAVITGADFSDAIIDRYQAHLLCQQATGTNPTTGITTKDSLRCR